MPCYSPLRSAGQMGNTFHHHFRCEFLIADLSHEGNSAGMQIRTGPRARGPNLGGGRLDFGGGGGGGRTCFV